MFSRTDRDRMLEAVTLARRGLFTASPNPRVGCLLVKHEQTIGRGWHRRAGLGHAEVEALADCMTDPKVDPEGATAYVTLEPCSYHGKTPPCTDALLKAGIARLVVGNMDPNPKVDGLQRLRDAGVEVATGCEDAACASLNPGFFSRMQRSRPWVRVKMAMSIDGRTALASGESKWITSEAARQDVQFWRAQADCILTGVGTVLSDNPRLNVRLSEAQFKQHGYGQLQQPLLAIADSTLKTSADALLFKADRDVVIYMNKETEMSEVSALANCQLMSMPSDTEHGVDLTQLLEDLAAREINEVHVEAGATLCAGLIKEQLVDELLLYIAPHLLGSDARGLFALTGLTDMAERTEFEFAEVQRAGGDLRVLLRPVASPGS